MSASFSIRVPLFNGGATIEAALRSLVSQSDGDWECIVVDDASTDDGVLRARRVADARIQVSEHPVNLGMTANWNRALTTAEGAFTLLLGQDDALLPDAVSTLRRSFERNPDVAMVAFGAVVPRLHGPDGHLARRLVGRLSPDELRRQALITGDTPAPSQVAYRSGLLAPLLPLDEAFRYCPEIDLQYRVGRAGHPAIFLTDCLGLRGNDPSRLTDRLRDTPVPLRDHYRLVEKHQLDDDALAAHQRRRLHRQATRQAIRALKRGNPRRAASFLKAAAQHVR